MHGKLKTITILLGSAALALLPSTAAGQFNNPPVTTDDYTTTGTCTIITRNVVANDSDPDGHPLTLISADYYGNRGAVWVENSTHIGFESAGTVGTAAISYTVSDSLGATATGTFTVTVTRSNFMCP